MDDLTTGKNEAASDAQPVPGAPEPPEVSAEPQRAATRAERRAQRGGRIRPGVVAGVVIALLAIFGVVGYFTYADLARGRLASDRLAEAQKLVEGADEVVLAVDEVVRSEVTTDVGADAQATEGRIGGARKDLEEAVRLIGRAEPDLDEEATERARLLRDAAKARLDMLDVASPILQANAKAANALAPAEDAWNAAVEAEKLTDQAVANYNRLNKAGATASKDLNTRAKSGFTRSRELFAKAETAFAEADFEAYLAYVDGKLRLVAISLQSDDAYLRGNISGANQFAATYNAEEQKVIALAKKLPDSPSRAVAAAYESVAGSATDDYFAARDRATEADAKLRGR